ncbi:MAG: Glycosyltransferase AglG [Methanomassiliicoccales archaeon PtaU1.Bin124]|nr:MAG: Glycosyltransferase AglG [Methanomassiliicoccales archaeon PtaU1.Bin124]
MEDLGQDVTVLILSLNRGAYLRMALTSVIQQTVRPKEVIVLDNGSKEDVKAAVLDLLKDNVKWEGADETHSPHWNTARGLAMVRTKYVQIMHDDDILDPHFLEEMVGFLSSNPEAAAVGCNGPLISPDGKEIGRSVLPRHKTVTTWYRTPPELALLYTDGHLLFPSIVYRRDAIQPDMVHTEYGKVGDSRMLFDVQRTGPIVHLDKMLYRYRTHGNQDSAMLPEDDYRRKDRFLIEVSASDPKLARRIAKNVYRFQTRRYLERAGSAWRKQGFHAMRASLREHKPDKFSIAGAFSIIPFAIRRSRRRK